MVYEVAGKLEVYLRTPRALAVGAATGGALGGSGGGGGSSQ